MSTDEQTRGEATISASRPASERDMILDALRGCAGWMEPVFERGERVTAAKVREGYQAFERARAVLGVIDARWSD